MPVSRETHERLRCFVDLLRRWNRRINLISRTDDDVLWDRHIEDSLQLLPLMRAGDDAAIDIGSGAGFPGLVLALASGRHFHLVESDMRKAAFLREASRLTGAPTTVHPVRAETLDLLAINLVTARAFARLPVLLEIAVRVLAPAGHCLFLKGRSGRDELAEARKLWHMTSAVVASETDPAGCILDLSEIARVRQ